MFNVVCATHQHWNLPCFVLATSFEANCISTIPHCLPPSFSPPIFSQSSQLPGYSPTFSHPAVFASSAAARLLTPALQKNTTSWSFAGLSNPNLSSNSSELIKNESGLEVIGMFRELGIVPVVWSSEGSRVSIRMYDFWGALMWDLMSSNV